MASPHINLTQQRLTQTSKMIILATKLLLVFKNRTGFCHLVVKNMASGDSAALVFPTWTLKIVELPGNIGEAKQRSSFPISNPTLEILHVH